MPALHQVKNSAVKGKQNLTVPPDGAVHLHPVEIQAVAVIHQTAEIQAVEVLHQTAEIQVAAVLHHAVQAAEVQELIPTVPVTVRYSSGNQKGLSETDERISSGSSQSQRYYRNTAA